MNSIQEQRALFSQIMDLLENGVQGIHLYTMNNVEVATRISRNIESIIAAKNACEA